MKKIIISLLGAALYFGQPAAAALPAPTHRIIDSYVDDYTLLATSDTEDGHITLIKIYNLNGPTLAQQQDCDAYQVAVDISHLKAGNYQAKIFTEFSPVYSYFFAVQ